MKETMFNTNIIKEFTEKSPAVCYPIGDNIIFCLGHIDADTEYELIKAALSNSPDITFNDSERTIQTKLGSYRFVPYDSCSLEGQAFKAYTLSVRAMTRLTIEEIIEIRELGNRLCDLNWLSEYQKKSQ